MTTAELSHSAGVRRVTLEADGITLSALVSHPEQRPPRATVVALHGAGAGAGYFDGQATPAVSLLALGARLGYTVLAVDRPGYGRSQAQLPEGQPMAAQVRTLRAALRGFAAAEDIGGGLFLLAHSFGGMLALQLAAGANAPEHLLGVDISGCGYRHPPDILRVRDPRRRALRSWGPLRLYPPSTFRPGVAAVAPVPSAELVEPLRWPTIFPRVARGVAVPVRFTFAEHESLWRHDPKTLRELRAHFTAAPRVIVERQAEAGHNISLGWAARTYHLRALGFLEDCLLRKGGA
ncbi:alpha/beta fold hydrolase [Nocardia sp. CDC159]|uniref:Alpha/beta fold hydrolase n=1 Tax=Nocardia pulmonis TaxID=2951408 RepID=A0A9X2ED43_9NOCA|nr:MULTISPECIES: alpha/beta hydrolase [Nocardia]MCM6778707.1 alpha/beta fold hydrolase [Nocardia pulmonis]MCM6791596.1 alpha/beta fold hydrolase [Nocardia sp. CDC159]